MPPIEAVLFDLDDTLHDDTSVYHRAADAVAREIAEAVADCYSIEPAALKRAYIAQADAFWQRLSQEHLSTRLAMVRTDLWSAALASLGVQDAALARRCADAYHRARRAQFAPFPGAVGLLNRIRARGWKLGLVTNGFSETHREKIELLQLGELFDAIFIADEVGMLKPDPAIFAHACRELGCAPDRSVMVGDRYDRDIVGAQRAGLMTVWMNVRRVALAPGERAPDAEVPALDDVERALERLNATGPMVHGEMAPSGEGS